VLATGRIVLSGTAAQLLADTGVQEAYLGDRVTKRLGLFTRLLAEPRHASGAGVPQRDRAVRRGERLGFDVGWVAQHHFDAEEGGLPSPLVFLAGVAAHTARIRLATGIITAALEDPIRVAEDTAVLDALSGGRVELGLGSGGSSDAFTIFGKDATGRAELYGESVARLIAALAGEPLGGTDRRLHPDGSRLLDNIWQATFSRTAVHAPARRIRAAAVPDPAPHRGRAARHPRATPAAIVAAHAAALTSAGLPDATAPRVGASRRYWWASTPSGCATSHVPVSSGSHGTCAAPASRPPPAMPMPCSPPSTCTSARRSR